MAALQFLFRERDAEDLRQAFTAEESLALNTHDYYSLFARSLLRKERATIRRALLVNVRWRLVAGGASRRCLLLHRWLRYRGSLVSGGGRDRLLGTRTQAKHDSRCRKKDKYFHS